MEENTEKAMEPTKKKSKVEEILEADRKNPPKRVNKTWEAAMRLKGSLIVNDPTCLLESMRVLIDTNIFVYLATDQVTHAFGSIVAKDLT